MAIAVGRSDSRQGVVVVSGLRFEASDGALSIDALSVEAESSLDPESLPGNEGMSTKECGQEKAHTQKCR